MSELHQQESEFLQLLRELPCDDALHPEHGAALREQVLAKFDQARAAETAVRSWQHTLFDLTPPADYKVQSFDVDVSKPGEQDLVNAFKLCGEISKGEFPDTLSLVGDRLFFITKHTKTRWNNPSDDDVQQLVKQMGAISRGLDFVLALAESADAHYAGKGVKQGTVDRPVFWYKSEGSKKYRVVYADLSVKDADQPPQVSGAVRLEKTSKTSRASEK